MEDKFDTSHHWKRSYDQIERGDQQNLVSLTLLYLLSTRKTPANEMAQLKTAPQTERATSENNGKFNKDMKKFLQGQLHF